MTAHEIQQVILSALAATNLGRTPDEQLAVSPDALIFGPGSPLDSLALVGLLADIEDTLVDKGIVVDLSDPRAMSRTSSPFRNVESLTAFVGEVVGRPS